MLFSSLMLKKVVTCITEKMCVRHPCLVMSYSTVSCEFNVNGSTVYIEEGVFKQKETHIKQCIVSCIW